MDQDAPQRRKFKWGVVILAVIGVPAIGSAAAISIVPTSVLWMSGIVCSRWYDLEYTPAHGLRCVSDAHVPDTAAIWGLQALLIALLLCAALSVGALMRRSSRKRT
jgi:hypothetical protein